MTKKEMKMLIGFLEDYDEYLGSKGYCDFDLRHHNLTKEEMVNFDKELHEFNGDPENHDPQWAHIQMDHAVLALLIHKLKESYKKGLIQKKDV